MSESVSIEGIRNAYQRIAPFIQNTPLTHSATFSSIAACEVFFKFENLQMTGSFKERGALNRLLALSDEEKQRGVIAASAGNHAQAVAYHAGRLGISVKIVMPRHSPLVKIRSTEHWGAEVLLVGETFDEAFQYSQELVAAENRIYIHPFNDSLVIEGQGTLGLEILEHELGAALDAILVPVGGGGLISGIASYVKGCRPEIQVIGVEERNCNAMSQSLAAGRVVVPEIAEGIADGIAVRKVAARNLETIKKLVDDVVSVSTDECANAIMLMMEIEKSVIEGAAAVTVAALVNNYLPALKDKKVLSVISGGNIDVNLLAKIINHGLAFDGRITDIRTVIPDRPGGLEKLLGVFRGSGANVLEVHHHRFTSDAPIGKVAVSVTIETRNQDHIKEIHSELAAKGYVAGHREK